MNQYVYTIMGVPEATLKTTKMSRAPQDAYNLRRLNYHQQIINQHNDRPKITGPWNLQAQFFFPIPSGKPKRHHMYPSLINLLRFFDELAHGVIYDDSCIIHDITLIKRYENIEPQSQFIFTRVQ